MERWWRYSFVVARVWPSAMLAGTVPGKGQRGAGGGFEDTGYVLIDVSNEHIVCIETLFYPEFVKALTELLP
jgi:hypothetical protein